jgi:hypothetical protein
VPIVVGGLQSFAQGLILWTHLWTQGRPIASAGRSALLALARLVPSSTTHISLSTYRVLFFRQALMRFLTHLCEDTSKSRQ